MDFFYQAVQKTTAHRASREVLVTTVLEMPKALENLLKIAASFSDKNHHKAAWAIEIIAASKPELFQDLQNSQINSFIEDENSNILSSI
jgi:uncharacterized BrkB/YihY/UPF0761 family membrane protein